MKQELEAKAQGPVDDPSERRGAFTGALTLSVECLLEPQAPFVSHRVANNTHAAVVECQHACVSARDWELREAKPVGPPDVTKLTM